MGVVYSQPAKLSVKAPAIQTLNSRGAFVEAMRSPWYELISELHDIFLQTTVHYANSKGLRGLFFPLTTRTVTCANALGSDSSPVPVCVSGVDTYLVDSMQFALEYGCRITGVGCYCIMPSFRDETPDNGHLIQFTHSEAEIIGDLEDLIRYVDGYLRAISQAILDRLGDRLKMTRGDISHLERIASGTNSFEQITFDEAVQILSDVDGAIQRDGSCRSLSRQGEALLMERVSEIIWIRHFDNLSVPFYQAFGDSEGVTAKNADLYFGMGEVVGAGERHNNADELRKSMAMHGVNESEYEWYVRMREEAPLRTSGFGMGVDRLLMWVLNHDDIRDLPIISRVDEPKCWPDAVVRP
jgi:asparaginyl-tRNA synthetase